MTILKKIGIFVFALLAVVTALSLTSHFYISSQRADAQSQFQKSKAGKHFSPEEIREDISYFQSLLGHVHPNAIPSFPLGQTRSALIKLAETVDQPLTHLAFYREIAPIGNLLNDEHTMVFPPGHEVKNLFEPGVNLFPFEVEFIDKKLYVVRNLSEESNIQAGMEIISINALPVEDLRTTIMTYYSGTTDAQKLFYAQENFREALYLVFGFSNIFELVIGASEPGETNNYVAPGKEFPERKAEEFHYKVTAPDTVLFTYNAFEDENDEFTNFLHEMFSTVQQQSIRHLIIDIRNNQGGASEFGDEILAYLTSEPFMQFSQVEITISEEVKSNFIGYVPAFIRWLPVQYFHPLLRPLWMGEAGETAKITFDPALPTDNTLRFNGDVYLLIGPGTMSSASLFAATMHKYDIATLIGENAGGYATLYGNIIDAHFPNTGLKVWMPTSVIYGNSAGPIVPEHVLTQTAADLPQQRDTVLEFALDLAQSGYAD